MATYKKNFLNSVVVRIDFNDKDLTNIPSYLKQISNVFPRHDKTVLKEAQVTLEVKSGVPSSSEIHNELTVWNLTSADDTKVAQISPKWLWIEYRKYKDSSVLLKDVSSVFDLFISNFGIENINRVGMLYSNVIKPPNSSKPTNWQDFINPDLISGITFANHNSIVLSRSMGQIVKHTDINDLRFDYGIWNPDYPNQIARKEFILSYDCYTNLVMETRDFKFSELVRDFNQQIEDLFEVSITDSLRKLMGKEV